MTKYYIICCIAAFLFGLVKGCYINTLAYRLSSEKKLFTRDCYCTNCGQSIRFVDQIPIFGYLLLHGKCRSCGASIGIHYPLVEGGCALVYTLIALLAASSAELTTLLGSIATLTYLCSLLLLKGRLRFSLKLIAGLLSLAWMDMLIWFGLTLANIAQ